MTDGHPQAASGPGRNGQAPKATGPVPGPPTSSSTVMAAERGLRLPDVGDVDLQGRTPSGQPDAVAGDEQAVGAGHGEEVEVLVEPPGPGDEGHVLRSGWR